jgi:hypothetical protein
MPRRDPVGGAMSVAKPTITELGVDVDRESWQRSGTGPDAMEVAFVSALGEQWVLTRVAGEPHGRVLVYNTSEWEAFLDGAKKGEFDDAQ